MREENKQPFYHRAVILFTATDEVDGVSFGKMLNLKLRSKGFIRDSFEVEEISAEPGDPHDLMGN